VVEELELVLASGITNLVERGGYSFRCIDCGTLIVRNAEAMQGGEVATCFKKNCGSQYRLSEISPDGLPGFQPLTLSGACPNCQSPIDLPRHKLALGFRFSCANCRATNKIAGFQVAVDPEATAPPG
jgi:hypothetical protein